MEELQLSETLQRYFSDVFLCCDEDKVGTASLNRTVELIKSGNVPDEVISQISDICWAPLAGNSLTRKQFYSALKLVAAYQANIPVRSDVLLSNLELPLPRFTWNTTTTTTTNSSTSSISSSTSDTDLIQLRPIITTATASSRDGTNRDGSTANHHLQSQNYYLEHIDANSSTTDDSEVDSDTLSNIVRRNNSTGSSPAEISSTASDSPTPTNSVQHQHQQDRNWTSAVISGGVVGGGGGGGGGAQGIGPVWHGLVSEEQRQLLGTEEESSDRHSSEDDDDDDDTEETVGSSEIWTINREQRDYYTAQFRSLQSDTNALLAGPLARTFFEKSRLPVHELRKIWQLADVTKDGALSLAEFMTAMHLVVLRRNHIELPESLPPSLFPGGNETPLSVSPEAEPILSSASSPPAPPPHHHHHHHHLTKDCSAKEWTKFIDSPTSGSNVSSPGPKPVNFDFQKITLDKDSTILHPVPLRVTPECSRDQQQQQVPSTCLATPSAAHQLLDQDLSGAAAIDNTNSAEISSGGHHHHHQHVHHQHHQQHHCSPIKKFSAALILDQANNSSSTSTTISSVINSSNANTSNATMGTTTPNTNHITTTTNGAAIIQRPQPKKKIHMIPGPPGAIPPPPQSAQPNSSSQQPTPSCEDGGSNGGGGPVSLPAFPPPKKEKPPPPPPRPFKTHGRSSSLDLNKLTKLGAPPSVPPRISPNIQQVGGGGGKKLINQKSEGDSCCGAAQQMSSSITTAPASDFSENPAFANFDNFDSNFLDDDPTICASQFEKYENVAEEPDHLLSSRISKKPSSASSSGQQGIFAAGDSALAPRKHGAFEVYQRSSTTTTTSSNINSSNNASNNSGSSIGKTSSVVAKNTVGGGGGNGNPLTLENNGGGFLPEERARWELFQKLQEENVVLLRICQELSQELADIREEKATLQLKLERQRERANLG